MKILKYFGYAFLVLVFGLILLIMWLRWDDPLKDNAQKYIRSDLLYQPHLKEHAFFSALGLNAKDDVDAADLGRHRYHTEWGHFLKDMNAEYTQIDSGLNQQLTRKPLSKEDLDLLKELRSTLIASPNNFSGLVVKHKQRLGELLVQEQVPLQRFQSLMQSKDYVSLVMQPAAMSVDSRYFINLQVLSLVKVELQSEKKFKDYLTQFNYAFNFTNNQLNLIEKMSTVAWLSQIIDLIRVEQTSAKQKITLPTMSPEQLSLNHSLRYEYAGTYITTRQKLSQYEREGYGFMLSLMLLPNKTFNTLADRYDHIWVLSETAYPQLPEKIVNIDFGPFEMYRLKNVMGNIYAQIEMPRYDHYLLKTHIVNNKIYSFNALNDEKFNLKKDVVGAEGRRYVEYENMLCTTPPYPQNRFNDLKDFGINSCVRI
jgi:hypothetical protein